MDSVTDMVFLCHPRMYYFIDQYDFQWLSHVFSFGLYHHRRPKKRIIHVFSSLQAPKCIKETEVSNSKFRQLFAGCHYNNIIFNLDYFS